MPSSVARSFKSRSVRFGRNARITGMGVCWLRTSATRTLYWTAQRGCCAIVATTRSGTPGFAKTFRTWLSVRKALASASLMACGWPSARSAPTTRAGPRRARLNFWPMGSCGTRVIINSSATRRISAGVEGSRLRRTRSNKYNWRSRAIAKRRGVRGWRARRRRTPSLAVHFPFSAIAVRTFAGRSRRSSIWEMCGSSTRGFSRSARRVSSSDSWISDCRSSLGADRACAVRAESSSGMCLALSKIDRHFGRSFGGFHLQRHDVGVRREFVQAGVNRGIEEFAAPVGATGFGDGYFAVLHREFSDDAVRKVAERSGGGGENFAGDRVTFVAKLADQGENAGEDVVRIFDYPVENASPLRAAKPLQHFGGESGLGAAIFFRTHHGGEGATANVECAAFIAEPGAASSGARGVAVSVASIGCGAGAYYQYYSFAFTHGGIQGDGEIGSDSDCGFGKCALEKSGDAFGDGFAAGA